MSATQEIRESIHKRLRAIEDEVDSLHQALARLEANGNHGNGHQTGRPATRSGSRRRAAVAPRKRASGRRSATVDAQALAALLDGGDGASATELAERLNADRAQVLARLKELEREGNVRRTGERRATRWHAITDEDRIRQRAAELERRSRRRATPGPAAA